MIEFDPYFQWLGIPADRRPPTAHDLVGLPESEKDGEAIYQAAMARYEQIRRYALSPHQEAAEHAQRILGEIAQALSDLSQEEAAEAEKRAEPGRETLPDCAAQVRSSLRKTASAHVDNIPKPVLGQAIALFSRLFQGDRTCVAVMKATEPNSTILFTERACYHLTDRAVHWFRYGDVLKCVGSQAGRAWHLYVRLAGQPSQKLLLTQVHSFMALRRFFGHLAGQSAGSGHN